MRYQYNIKENLIKPVLTPNVVTRTGKNFPATGMICEQYLRFLSDGDTFRKLSETPESHVIPISPSASAGPPPKAKQNSKGCTLRPILAGFPIWKSPSPGSQGARVQPKLLFGAVRAQLIPQPSSALGCSSQHNSWLLQ